MQDCKGKAMSEMLSAPLEQGIANRLLDLLSSDDAYRARFARDPRGALTEIGYESPPGSAQTACGATLSAPEPLIDCRVENLASKETIAAARNEILAMLTRGLGQNPPELDTGFVGKRVLK